VTVCLGKQVGKKNYGGEAGRTFAAEMILSPPGWRSQVGTQKNRVLYTRQAEYGEESRRERGQICVRCRVDDGNKTECCV
jgi:hypothetical protein